MSRRSLMLGLTGIIGLTFSLLPQAYAQSPGPCDPPIRNPIVCENSKPGNPAGQWNVSGVGDPTIQGFATEISVNKGETVRFKVDTNANDYSLDIYRMGYYGGMGARKVTTVRPSVPLPQAQPACLDDPSTGLIDCGNWAVSASWAVPADAVSGVYFAKLVRADTGGASHIFFIVRDDAGASDLLFQTSDTTWQAYNSYGGNSLYTGAPAGRAYKVSYNRPFNTRVTKAESWVFNAEYPMVRWLEANGYNVSYFTGVDSDRRGAEILEHKVFLSVGHDEYWSAAQRANVEAARAAGVDLAFFSGNEVFWKTRWEPSIDASNTPYRTLVCYKETHANAKIDPTSIWTGTWRDPRFSPPADGGRPENALTGTIFTVNDGATSAITVPHAFSDLPFWRNTRVANLTAGQTAAMPFGTLGYEWDEDLDNGFRPAGLVRLSSTTVNVPSYLLDHGSTYGPGTATHSLTLYRAGSGALVFGAGTVQWSWGLDSAHDFGPSTPDPAMQQATVNLFADMGVQPATLQPGLVAATRTCPCTIWNEGTTPAVTSQSDPQPIEVGLKFRSAVDGFITGLRFYKGPANTGTHVGKLWTSTGTLLASVTFTGESASGWQQANLSAPVATAANTTYVASYHTDAGGYAVNQDYFGTAGVDNSPLRALRDGEDGPNGVYQYGPGGFPTLTFGSSNYWVDVVFDTSTDVRSFTLNVTKTGTGSGTVSSSPLGIDCGPTCSAAFDNGSAVTLTAAAAAGSTFAGWSGGGCSGIGACTVTMNAATTVAATFNRDTTGTFSIWSDAVTPAVASQGDSNPVEVGVRFRASSDGLIRGLRFYKGPANTGTHVGNLWTSGGTLLGSVTFTSESASGWQQMDLPTPVAISANTTYVASYHTSAGGYALNQSYFATSGVDSSPLRALRDGEDGPNGVYLYGAGGFPTQTFGSSNYWVDVLFEPTIGSGTVTLNVSKTGSGSGTVTSSPIGITCGATCSAAYDTGTLVTLTAVAAAGSAFTGWSGGGCSGIGACTVTMNAATTVTATFTQQATASCPCSIWSGTTTPTIASQNDMQPIEVGIRFRSISDGFITALRFYKGPANTGTHVGKLWNATGTTLLASATFTGETSSGWQQVDLPSPVAITANTTYVVSYHTDSGGYAVDQEYFASAGVDNPPLRALRDGEDGPNGVYLYGLGGFPTQTFRSSNYWVDVVFNTTIDEERVAAPTFSPPGGTYTAAQTVAISTTTTGATIHYTLDGSTPTTGSTVYTGPISVTQTTTIRAIAVQSGLTDSAVASATYTITPPQQVATPTFSPAGGTYSGPQTVTLSTTTSGATIHYTTDGSTPTTSSPIYTGPISVTQTTTIGAMAVKSGMTDSDVASATYTIVPLSQVATPTFSPAGGTYSGPQTVALSTTTSGATIHYTTDGTTPTASSPVYTGPISVTQTTTIRAMAAKSGMADSDVASAIYTIVPLSQVATPTFTPPGGTYSGPQTVALSTTTSGATIHYTTDGSTPTASSTLYVGAIAITQTTTINAIAVKSGMTDSAVASATYTLKAFPPTFAPPAGTYVGPQTVTLSTTTSGATIRYTTDGSTPTTASTAYTGPIAISQTTTIKAIAVKSGMADSDVASATYTLQALPPTFNPPTGTYVGSQTVALSSATSGATIHYTTDGTTPTTSSPVYTAAIAITQTTTIKAMAVKSGMLNSAVASAAYTLQAVPPTFSPGGGTYVGSQTIALSTVTSGATIHYTTDGSTPTTSSPVYTGAISVTLTTTIKAMAVKSGMLNSTVATAVYTLQAVAPTFSLPTGTYVGSQTVALSTVTSGATIHYTTDGTTPTTASAVYAGAISVTQTTTIKAMAVKSGMLNSTVASAVYTLQAVPPTFSPGGGTYVGSQTIALSSVTSGATIHYTTDGATPTTASPAYTGAISVTKTTTIKAIAVKSGMLNSTVASATYTLRAVPPTFSPPGATYNQPQSVALSTVTSGATIRYTTDGTTPTTASPAYTGPISVTRTTTIRAIATATGMLDSTVASAVYTLKAATPTFSPPAGSYLLPQFVEISSASPGTTIYYTTDGSTPTTSSTQYTGAILVATTTTIKAIAVAPGWSQSNVASATYTFLLD